MNDELRDEMLELLSKYQDDIISDDDMQRMEELILSDDDAKLMAVTVMDMDAEIVMQNESLSLTPEIPVTLESKSKTKPVITFILSMAAALLIGLFINTSSTNNSQGPEIVAIVTDCQNAEWASYGSENRMGKSIHTGDVKLLSGSAEFTFTNGARVRIKAPASLRIHNNISMALEYGQLSAHIPEAAKGFTIDTSDLRVIDLGTEFAVNLPQGGEAEVHVFSGLVQTESLATEEVKSILTKQTVKFSKSENTFKDSEFSNEKFIDPPKFSGIPSTTGGVKFLQGPPAALKHKTFQHNYIIAFAEKEVLLPDDMPLAGINPGHEPHEGKKGRKVFSFKKVAKGTRVKSFMLHYDSQSSGAMYSYGSITFPYPIIGYIPERKSLNDTDQLFGANETAYFDNHLRGLDVGHTKLSQIDHIILSEDRKTLILSWHNSIAIDQVRVLVEVPEQ